MDLRARGEAFSHDHVESGAWPIRCIFGNGIDEGAFVVIRGIWPIRGYVPGDLPSCAIGAFFPFLSSFTSDAILHGGEAESASTEAIAPAVTILGGGQHDGTTEVDRLQVGLARVHRPDRWAGGEGGRGRTIPFLLSDYGADLSYHIGGFGRSWSYGYDSFRWEAEDRGPTGQAARTEARPGSAVRVGGAFIGIGPDGLYSPTRSPSVD